LVLGLSFSLFGAYNGLKLIPEATIAPSESEMSSLVARTHKEYQRFVKNVLALRGIVVPLVL